MNSAKIQIPHLQELLEKEGVLSLVQATVKKFPEAHVYLVGGLVRDSLMNRESLEQADIDLVFGKVSVKELEGFLTELGKVDLVGKSFGVFKFTSQERVGKEPIDIALPRTDHSFLTGGYHDFEIICDPQLPIEQDMERRDFTINAMAIDLVSWELIDVFSCVADLNAKIIRCVGDAKTRFAEDYTRMLRAVRFACQLGFEIEAETMESIVKYAENISNISPERVRDEINKIIMSKKAEHGFRTLGETKMLASILPELASGIGVTQNKNHIYTVFEHNIRALGFAVERDYSFIVRIAALFHDIGKPRTKKGDGYTSTFYNHDIVGGQMVKKLMERLKYSTVEIKQVAHLVRNHMFYYSLGEITDAGVRRLLVRLGSENIHDFIKLRICDRLGMGRPKGKPYKLIELERRLQVVQLDPISPKMLALNGNEIMEILSLSPSRRVGLLTKALLSDVLDYPEKNTKEYLTSRVIELHKLSDDDLRKMSPDVDVYEKEREREVLKKYKEAE